MKRWKNWILLELKGMTWIMVLRPGASGPQYLNMGGGWFTVEFGDDIKDSITDYLLEYHESDLEVIAAYKLMDEPGPVKDVYKP